MSKEVTTPASCQTAVRRRFIPIPYVQWFDSVHNKTKAFSYMSKESFKYYYKWCERVSKTYA
jgi:hypothetical protein